MQWLQDKQPSNLGASLHIQYRYLPQIKVDPENPERQKATPAAKLYKETLQQYTNVIKVLAHCTGQDADSEESPLRKWARKFVDTA